MREPKVAPLLNWRRLHEQAIEFKDGTIQSTR